MVRASRKSGVVQKLKKNQPFPPVSIIFLLFLSPYHSSLFATKSTTRRQSTTPHAWNSHCFFLSLTSVNSLSLFPQLTLATISHTNAS
jgi:hypothetical protein